MKTLYDEPLNKMASDEARSSSHQDSIAHPISALKQTPFRSDLLRSLRTSSSDVETLSLRPITSVRFSPRGDGAKVVMVQRASIRTPASCKLYMSYRYFQCFSSRRLKEKFWGRATYLPSQSSTLLALSTAARSSQEVGAIRGCGRR